MKIKSTQIDQIIKELDQGDATQRACAVALRFGDIDGNHHKQWIIDQMLRTLAGEAYQQITGAYNAAGYRWDTGRAP